MAIKNKTLVDNPALRKASERAKNGNGRIHLAGLVSFCDKRPYFKSQSIKTCVLILIYLYFAIYFNFKYAFHKFH